jgi:hypothetical protein
MFPIFYELPLGSTLLFAGAQLKIKKNHTFLLGLENADIIPKTHPIFRVDARFSPKANFEPIFLVLAYL